MRGELVISPLLAMTGIAFVLLGILMWRKDKIELLHYYHYKNVSKEERQHYVKIVGKIYIFFRRIIYPFCGCFFILAIWMDHILNRFYYIFNPYVIYTE